MRRVLLFCLIIGLCSCETKEKSSVDKRLDLGAFSLEAPASWTYIKEPGVDSYVGRISIDEVDTLSFDLGWYSNMLNEDNPVLMDSSVLGKLDPKFIDTSIVTFVKNISKVDKDRYRHNNIRWDTIDNRLAKIIFPVTSGKGITGVYIDSLWVSGSDVDRFNLYGINLKPQNEAAVLKAIKTLKFTKS